LTRARAEGEGELTNRIWDLAPSRVLVEEAGGRYRVVRDFTAPDGGQLLSAVFGRPVVVERVVAPAP
jgi:fructose-1,6-bisphosphatase/inositol monophosphatase family enzyme